jgi:hypothetical protein
VRQVIGGSGNLGKVAFDSDSGVLRIWRKGWIGKRKYRIKVDQVIAVKYGMYTTRIRLLGHGFNLIFQDKGENVVVTVTGDGKKFTQKAEEMARSIGMLAGLSEFKVVGASVFFSRVDPDSQDVGEIAPPTAADGSPLTKTEQVISSAARGTKNVASEIVMGVGHTVSGIGKVILYGIGGIVIISALITNPLVGVFLMGLGIYLYRKNR